ncbi:primosomal protein DnaI, partial [Mobiluncus curtisii]|nr:primosomal protein DnaI [Mobiluncus curtisii]
MFSEPILPLDDFAPPEPREVRVHGVEKPVAAVLLNTFAPALSHPLDFLIPAKLDAVAVPGVLVKVKVGAKRYTGVIVERKDSTDWQKPLREIERTLGDLPLLDIPTLELLENVSLYYGTGPSAL